MTEEKKAPEKKAQKEKVAPEKERPSANTDSQQESDSQKKPASAEKARDSFLAAARQEVWLHNLRDQLRYFSRSSGRELSVRDRDILERMNRLLVALPNQQREEMRPVISLLLRNLSHPQLAEFAAEISDLKSEINKKTHALVEKELSAKDHEKQIEELRSSLQVLNEKQKLSHLLTRVGAPAQERLLSSTSFRRLFDQESPHPSYVLSIDIRRSTELMLKARTPRLYAEFISDLASQLRDVILQNFGVFDKFTGDGILAFFPAFYSGDDAGYSVLKAADECHQVFARHYALNKHCFISILKDIGLGVGIDYGEVQMLQIGGDFTVVGTPVVYACRMGGANAGNTFINQPAYEKLFEGYSAVCDFEEREITIKHEGNTLAYSVELNGKAYSAKTPEWLTASEEDVDSDSRPS